MYALKLIVFVYIGVLRLDISYTYRFAELPLLHLISMRFHVATHIISEVAAGSVHCFSVLVPSNT